MLRLCFLLLAARVGVLAELQTEEAACSSESCEEVNAPMCGYDETNKLKAYFLNECVFNCSNCLYQKSGSKAKFVKIINDECMNDSNCVFIHECPSPASDGAVQPDPAVNIMPFPMLPGPVMFGDANRGQEGVSMGPLLPDIYGNPQWMFSDPRTPDFSSSSSPGSLSPDMNLMPGISDIDRNEISDTGDSNSDDGDDLGFIAPSLSPYMVPMFTDKVSVNDDTNGMAPVPVPVNGDQSEFGDSPGPINVDPAFNSMFAPESVLQDVADDSADDVSDDDLLSDGLVSMMDNSPNNDFGGTFPDFQIGPVGQPLLSTDDGIAGDSDPFGDTLTTSPSEETDDSSDILTPDDLFFYGPSDSSDDNGSDEDLLDIISSILEDDSNDGADTVNNPGQSISYFPNDSPFEISVIIPDDGVSTVDSPLSEITITPQDILVPMSDDTQVNQQGLILPLSEASLSGDQGTSDDVILLSMDPSVENAGDDDSSSDTAADEGSDVLIFIPEEDSSDESAFNDDSGLSALSGGNDVPVINVITAQPETRGYSGGFSNLLESLLLQKLLFNTDSNEGNSKQGNTYINAKVQVEINVQPDEDKPSRNQHHPMFWNDDRDGFPRRPNSPGYGFRENDVDYTPAARQAALVMTTIGKTATSSSAVSACSVLLPVIVSFFVIIV